MKGWGVKIGLFLNLFYTREIFFQGAVFVRTQRMTKLMSGILNPAGVFGIGTITRPLQMHELCLVRVACHRVGIATRDRRDGQDFRFGLWRIRTDLLEGEKGGFG